MGSTKEFGYTKVRESSESAADAVRFTTLVVPDGSLLLEGADEAHLTGLGGATWTEAALSTFTDLTDALLTLGADATLVVDSTTAISTNEVIPASIFLRFAKGAMLTKSGSGTIEFEGYGLIDPTSATPIFSGFANGDITWTGTEWPKRISSELQYYAHDWIGERLNFIDAALLGKFAVIETHPRTIGGTSQTVMDEHHHLEFLPGDFPNSWAVSFVHPFSLKSNTSFRSNPPYGARIYESSDVGFDHLQLICAHMMEVAGANGTCENIWVEDNYFVGDEAQSGSSSQSTVILGNVINGGINRNIFYRTHGYNILGGYGTVGNYAENATINDNKFIGCGTQVCAVINGKNLQIARNYFDQKNSNGSTTYGLIDIEPNTDTGRVENIILEDNIIDARDAGTTYFVNAIAIQATEAPSAKNITIRNNTIFGAELSESGTLLPLVTGITITGGNEIYCYGNTVRGAFQRSYNVSQGRYVRFHDNTAIQSTDVTGDFAALTIYGCADSDFYHNNFSEGPHTGGQSSGILEGEIDHTVTAIGTAITVVNSFAATFYRTYEFYKGLTATIMRADYGIAAWVSTWALTSATTIPTITQENFAAGDVNTGTDSITVTAHNYVTGGKVWLSTTSTAPGGLTANRIYFVIVVDTNTVKLADTEALADAGTPIDITSGGGGGTHTLTPIMTTKFSHNKFWGNKADDGTTLEPTGTSAFHTLDVREMPVLTGPVTTSAGSSATSITDRAVTFIKLPTISVPSLLGADTGAIYNPITWDSVLGMSVSGADNKLTKTASTGSWANAGATSVQKITGDGNLKFKIPTSGGEVMAGLAYDPYDTGSHYTNFDYNFYCSNTTYIVYELGVSQVTSSSFTPGTTEFEIRRVGTTVTYYVGGSLVDTSSVSSTGDLYVVVAMEANGSTFGNAVLTDEDVGDITSLTPAEVRTLLDPLDADTLNGATFAAPGSIGSGTPAPGTFTDLVANGSSIAEGLLARVTSVDMDTATATTLYTVPSGKTCVITKVVVRQASASLTTASYSFGYNVSAFDNVIANATHTELTASTFYTMLLPMAGAKYGAATDSFKVLMNTLQGGAATTTMEVFGYLF